MAIKCPKCGYERGPGESTPAWQCPGCGVAYSKVMVDRTEREKPLADAPKPPPPVQLQTTHAAEPIDVHIIDVRMRFWSMVIFMVKWAIASIPALMILIVIGTASFSTLGAILIGATTYKKTVAEARQPASQDKPLETAARERRVEVGMSQQQVRIAWGEPESREVSASDGITKERWRYPGKRDMSWRFVAFENGIVTAYLDPE